jgi:hypothetical protein
MPELEPPDRDVRRLLGHVLTPRLNGSETGALAADLASLR